jgi:hypothetical protein
MATKKQEVLILATVFEVFDESSQIPGALLVSTTKFCTMASNICDPQYGNQMMSQFW